jgi:molecular chaperone DnaK
VKPVLGIDFGTSHMSVGAQVDGVVRLVSDNGEFRIPAVVHAPRRGDLLVGGAAATHAFSDPTATASGIKRLLGSHGEPEVAAWAAWHGLRLTSDGRNEPLLWLRGEPFPPVQLATSLLRHLRERAHRTFGECSDAVLTVPAGCTREYLGALSRASKLAGINVRRFIAEPIAAMVSSSRKLREVGTYLVCDFGGGTFDVTVARWDGRVVNPILVDGDNQLGGDDFDQALMEGIASMVFQRDGHDLRRDVTTWGHLRVLCEGAKRRLSSESEALVTMRDAYVVQGTSMDISLRIDRGWANARWLPLVTRAGEVTRRALQRASLQVSDLAGVLLVGGTCYIPLVQSHLRDALACDVTLAEEPELSVVRGAVYVAGIAQNPGAGPMSPQKT